MQRGADKGRQPNIIIDTRRQASDHCPNKRSFLCYPVENPMKNILTILVLVLAITFSNFAWDNPVVPDGFSWAQLFSVPLDGVGDSPLVP
jgi:hypothetical protein